MIEIVDFNNLLKYKGKDFSPVLFLYKKEAFSVVTKENQIENSWNLFFKIFLNRYYNDYQDIIENNFMEKYLFKNASDGHLLFSHSDEKLNNRSQKKNDVVKFDDKSYFKIFNKDMNKLLVIKKIIESNNFKGLKLYIAYNEDIDTDDFNKEYKKLSNKYKKYNIKKAIFVASHINGKILNDFEKLVKYVRDEFKTRKLIGDIKITEQQEKLLNDYMQKQLNTFVSKPDSFTPEYPRLFALGLVRYAMRHYNKNHKGEFWPYFTSVYGTKIVPNNQKYIHDVFENVLKKEKLSYLDNSTNKIDNITMHTFVSDNSASQLFDYLLDFWRLDLLRNTDNFNNKEDGIDVFNELINAMSEGTQSVMSHTSQLLKFPKLKTIFKNRIKRILRLINDAFWNESSINETGNRINHLLNVWIAEPNGAFQKEKKYIAKHTSKTKGEILYHSPILKLNIQENKLQIILPAQRLINCDDTYKPEWIVETVESVMHLEPEFKKDKIGYYVDRSSVEIPLDLMLNNFKITLQSNDEVLKKYEIKSSKIRFFDSNGKHIDHTAILLPQGFVTCYSDSNDYPKVLGEEVSALNINGLYLKNLNLSKGQIIVLDDNSGVQVGQKLNEGYTESYPISGLIIKENENTYEAYSKLPKLLFKAETHELNGISLSINSINYKVVDLDIKEFRIANELNISGYLLDLCNLIKTDGIYEIFLSYPKYKVQLFHSSFVYINGFKYNFINSPYIFKEEAILDLPRRFNFKNINNGSGNIAVKRSIETNNISFNFAERDPNQVQYCSKVKGEYFILEYDLNGKLLEFNFYIPSLYWKFNLSDEWNVRKPKDIVLKELKNIKKKLYLSGPFDLNKIRFVTDESVDIALEESEIKCTDLKNKVFDLSKVYDWFSDRDETYKNLYLKFNENKQEIFSRIVCKSILKSANLIADFDNNLLLGDVNIEGNESYTISIYHNKEAICEDKQIVDGSFEVECQKELESGNYEIYVYEIVENEADGFDVETSSIILNKEPIVRKVINISNLENSRIILNGYQDKENKYLPVKLSKGYYISNLKKTSLDELKEDGTLIYEDDELSNFYGIWDNDIDYNNESYLWYKGDLMIDKNIFSYKLDKVLVMFTNKLDIKSVYVFIPDDDGAYSSLVINTKKEPSQIVTGYQHKKLTSDQKRQCTMFNDYYSYLLIDIRED